MQQMSPGRPEAAAAIWQWRAPAEAADEGPSPRARRLKGALQGAVGGTVATLVYLTLSPGFGIAIAVVASVVFLAAMLSPLVLYEGIQRLFSWTGVTMGRAVAWVTMVALFYGFFLPFGRLFRRGRRDSMKRYYDPGSESYWTPREAADAPSDYERLF